MRVADVRLSWKRSVSIDVAKRTIEIVKDGNETIVAELGAEVSEYMIELKAIQSCSFTTTVTDKSGRSVVSEVYVFQVDDLEDPQPDTELSHEIVAVRDVEE